MPGPDSPLPEVLPSDPLPLLGTWFEDARRVLAARNPDAMTLATVDARGRPVARMVICRGVDLERGTLRFFTDTSSPKGRELGDRPFVACVFHWDAPLHRQLRVEGSARPLPRDEVEAYFRARPGGAQVAAWASDQSAPLLSRADLVERQRAMAERFGVAADAVRPGPLDPPDRWGGFRVWIDAVEFWVGQPGRLHERQRYLREGDRWVVTLLQP